MCAICGFFAPDPYPVAAALRMLERTSHRGPDSAGIYWDGHLLRREALAELRGAASSSTRGRIALGHARLEIVGGPDGIQPLTGCRPGWAIVANGEIYNHEQLRRFLQGHPTATDSDNELILHLIEQQYHDGDLARAVAARREIEREIRHQRARVQEIGAEIRRQAQRGLHLGAS